MNKRSRASLLLAPTYACIGLSAQEKNQLFLAFIPGMTDWVGEEGISGMRHVPGFDPGCLDYQYKRLPVPVPLTLPSPARGEDLGIRASKGGGKGGTKKSPLRVEPQRGLR